MRLNRRIGNRTHGGGVLERSGLTPLLLDWSYCSKEKFLFYTESSIEAEEIYGFHDCWVTHNPLNPMGHTGLQFYGPGLWYPEGSAWLLRHLVDHYDFTRGRKFLEKIYPILQGNVKFWLQYLVKDPLDPGVLSCCPTCLPEQPPYTMAASMSMQAAEDLLRNFIRVSQDLGNLPEEDLNLLPEAEQVWKRMDHGLRVDEQEGIIRDWKYKPSRTGETSGILISSMHSIPEMPEQTRGRSRKSL